jgi:uncharacterized protein YdeI (YjbR/CyaY-like superfamily)
MKQRLFKNRMEWREWLEKHHGSEKELWLIYYKKHCGKESIQYEEAVEEAICYGWIDSKVIRLDTERYMQRYTPRRRESNWSKSNKRRVDRLIENGQMTKAGLTVVEAAKQDGSWERLDDIETKAVIPDDLAEALVESPIAMKFFHRLAPSHQKQYLWWLNGAKKLETRKNRLLSIIERCERGVKPGN